MKDSQNHPVFVVFEGLDGAGKTTLAALTAESLGADLLTTPSPDVRRYRDELIEGFGECQEACQLFYLSTVFAAADDIRKRLRAGRSVVLDRYFISTQAYAAFRGSRLALDDLAELLLPADLTVFVDAPLQERINRLSRRGASAADRETMSMDADATLRQEHLARFGLPVVGAVLHLNAAAALPASLVERIVAEVGPNGRASAVGRTEHARKIPLTAAPR